MQKFKFKKRFRYTNTLRIGFQSIILLLLVYVAVRPLFDSNYIADFEAYCPFGGLSALMSKLHLGSLSCQMGETQIFLGVTLLIGALLFGKLFCSYICPIGAVTEWLGKIGAKYNLRMDMPKLADRGLRIFKYALLFISIYITMNTSELFCKEFDPYYAVVTGFSSRDIVLWFALPALIITVLGAIFFRLFWCKYLCPLGAIANIFNNFIPTLGVIVTFIIAHIIGVDLSWIWLLGALVVVGAFTEIGFMRSFGVNFTKIKRTPTSCTMCGLCDDKCPEGITVSQYETVDHVDCHLCTDCVYACPIKNTLNINGKPTTKYLMPIATVILIALSLAFSGNFELATLSERWGNFEKYNSQDKIKVFEQTNLASVKCFGSATAFKNQISRVKGIYGLDAYATSHTVDIYYNPEQITPTQIKKAIFKPVKMKLRTLPANFTDSLDVALFRVEKIFDRTEETNLAYAIRKVKGVYGIATQFGEPVKVFVYYDAKKTTPEEIQKAMRADEVELKYSNGKTVTKEIDFDVYDEYETLGKISVRQFNREMFTPYSRTFNHYRNYKPEQLEILIYPFPEGASSLSRRIPYLVSHLSNNKGIVRFSTRYTDKPVAMVYFDPEKTTLEEVKKTISAEKLKVHFRDGSVKEVENPFKSKPDGEVIQAAEIKKYLSQF